MRYWSHVKKWWSSSIDDVSRLPREAPENKERDSAFVALRASMKDMDKMTADQRKSLRKQFQALDKKYLTPATVQHVVDHIDHIVKIAGIDHVGWI